MAETQVIRDFVCTACGCACDDLALTVEGRRIVGARAAVPAWRSSFCWRTARRSRVRRPIWRTRLNMPPRLLRAARAPLVMGFERATVEAQRLAVEIADRLGAAIDPTDDRGASRSHAAVQTVGAVTATLGEVAQRSDLVVYWDCDPATTHPRHMERFASRDGGRTIVVATWPTPTRGLGRRVPADTRRQRLRVPVDAARAGARRGARRGTRRGADGQLARRLAAARAASQSVEIRSNLPRRQRAGASPPPATSAPTPPTRTRKRSSNSCAISIDSRGRRRSRWARRSTPSARRKFSPGKRAFPPR